MILRLVRYRIADARIPMLALFASASTAFIPVDFWATALLGGLPLVACMGVIYHLHERVTAFERALPLATRTVLSVRTLSVLGPMWVPLTVWIIATWLRTHDPRFVSIPVAAAMVISLALLLPNLIKPRAQERPRLTRVASVWAALATLVAVLSLVLPVTILAVLLSLALIALLIYLVMTAPPSFVDTVIAAPPTRSDAHAARANRAFPRVRPWWTEVARHTGYVPIMYLNLGLIVLHSMSANLLNWFVIVIAGSEALRLQQRWLAELPLSVRQRFLAVAIPSVVFSTLCVGLGHLLPVRYGSGFRAMGVGAPNPLDDWDKDVSESAVPLPYWQRAATPDALTIIAPWGERAHAYHMRVLGATYMNPYSVVAESSERFRAWQFARATRAVYGREIDRTAYRAERTNLPRRTTGTGLMVVLQGGVLMASGFLLLWLAELGRWRRKHIRLLYRSLPAAGAVVITAVSTVEFLYIDAGGAVAVSLVQHELLRLMGWLPGSSVARWSIGIGISVSLALATYRLAEWQFARAELPRPRRW